MKGASQRKLSNKRYKVTPDSRYATQCVRRAKHYGSVLPRVTRCADMLRRNS